MRNIVFGYSNWEAWGGSPVDQITPSTALDVLHHKHAEGGSSHSGTVFVGMHTAACSAVTNVCIDLTPDWYKLC